MGLETRLWGEVIYSMSMRDVSLFSSLPTAVTAGGGAKAQRTQDAAGVTVHPVREWLTQVDSNWTTSPTMSSSVLECNIVTLQNHMLMIV